MTPHSYFRDLFLLTLPQVSRVRPFHSDLFPKPWHPENPGILEISVHKSSS